MLDDYRRDFSEFHTASAREHYLFHSGQKKVLEIAPIYERYGHLFDREAIDNLRRELSNTSDHFETQQVSIGRLLASATEQFLEDSVKQLTEEISRYEATATIDLMDRQMTFQEATVVITTESDRQSRRAIYDKRLEKIEASNDLRAERLLKLHETALALGYSSYLDLFQQLRRIDYSQIEQLTRDLLSRTEHAYITRLSEVLGREIGLTLEEAERSDAMYVLHLTGFDSRFPASEMLPVYRATMAGLGINTDLQSNIEIDNEPRPRKNPRAFCAPVSIPEDIKLVIRPAGGQSDYQALLHESGHAQHYGWASPQLQPEFKYTGDYALTETYAFLFNNLISDAEWLRMSLGVKDWHEFIRSVMLARLVTVRRYAAKLAYERELHVDDNLDRSSKLYADLQTSATGFKTEPAEFLFDLDDSFYSASYLRAWAFEVILREHLKTKFGARWWGSRRAGDFLKEMWETGDRYTADEMAAQIGIGPIVFDTLIDEFNRTLK